MPNTTLSQRMINNNPQVSKKAFRKTKQFRCGANNSHGTKGDHNAMTLLSMLLCLRLRN